MYKIRLSLLSFAIGLALVVVLAIAMTLAAIAQGPIVRDEEVPPDEVIQVEEVELLPDLASPNATAYFKFISANTFVPYDDDMVYSYYTSGCMHRVSGGNYTEHTLQLPQGAEIDYLRIFFYDNDPDHDASVYLYAYDGYGNSTLINSVSSSGANDYYTSKGSGFFSHFVDNVSEALSLSFYYGNATTSDLRICGVRVRYQYSFSITHLPLILNGDGP